jgi:hypothetical protein
MDKMNLMNKKKYTIIDTVEYNGRYTDVTTIRTKIVAASLVIVAALAFICTQLFWI